MTGRQKASQGSQRTKSRRLVKNKVMIGDARLNAGIKPDARGAAPRVSAGSVARENHLASQFPDKAKRLGRTDGTKFKREIAAKKNRATQVYGSRKAALKASYRKDKTTGQRIEGSEYKPKKKKTSMTKPAVKRQTGGLGTMSNPIIGSDGRSARNKKNLI